MKQFLALLIMLLSIPMAQAQQGWGGTINVRSIGADRIAVIVPDGSKFRVIVYQDEFAVPFIAPNEYKGSVLLSTGSLEIVTDDFNFKGQVGEGQTGWGIGSYFLPDNIKIGNVNWEHFNLRISEFNYSDTVHCEGGHAVEDTSCQFGGPMANVSPGFKCSITNAGSPHILQLSSIVGEAGPLNSGDCKPGSYPCGSCDGWGNAHQTCKKDTCTSGRFPEPIKCH